MKLHHFPLSGHAHRAHLFLSLLGVEHEVSIVDLPNGAHKSPEFLKLNPLGQVPVLEDGDVVIADSIAIMTYVNLAQIESQLSGNDWIALDHPTIADVALYSYIANAPEGNVDLAAYDNVRAWLKRVEALPGFVAFEQTVAGLRKAI